MHAPPPPPKGHAPASSPPLMRSRMSSSPDGKSRGGGTTAPAAAAAAAAAAWFSAPGAGAAPLPPAVPAAVDAYDDGIAASISGAFSDARRPSGPMLARTAAQRGARGGGKMGGRRWGHAYSLCTRAAGKEQTHRSWRSHNTTLTRDGAPLLVDGHPRVLGLADDVANYRRLLASAGAGRRGGHARAAGQHRVALDTHAVRDALVHGAADKLQGNGRVNGMR
jgi:hypothetical protein